MAKAKLESISGGHSLTPGRAEVVDVDDLPKLADKPAKGKRKSPTATELSDLEAEAALESLVEAPDVAEADVTDTAADILRQIDSKITRMRANHQYWERIDYAKRLMLIGAQQCAKEARCETDESGLPKTLSRFLGVQFPSG